MLRTSGSLRLVEDGHHPIQLHLLQNGFDGPMSGTIVLIVLHVVYASKFSLCGKSITLVARIVFGRTGRQGEDIRLAILVNSSAQRSAKKDRGKK